MNTPTHLGVATCPPGKRVLGGGAYVGSDVTPISGDRSFMVIGDSHPFPGFPSPELDSWRVRAERLPPATSSWRLVVQAVCAPATP